MNKYVVGLIAFVVMFVTSYYLTRSYNESRLPAGAASSQGAAGQGDEAGQGGGQPAGMEQAQAAIKRARENPKDYNAQVAAIQMELQIGNSKGAIEFLKNAYEANPKDVRAPATLGEIYFQQKNYSEAENWYRRALQVEPTSAELRIVLAEMYTESSPPQPDKAIAELQQVRSLDPKNAHALEHLIGAYALKKDARGAEDALSALKQAESNNPKIAQYEAVVRDLKEGKPVTLPKE